MVHRRAVIAGSAAAFSLACLSSSWSQPVGKAVRLVVPFPAGGGTDAIARLIAERLRSRYAPTIIVDNRVGGGGRIGVESIKNAAPDGSLILFTPDFPLTLYPHTYKSLPYAARDFAPVAPCGVVSMAIAAGPGLPTSVKTILDFVQWCKSNPKSASYGSPSAGSTAHFAGMMLGRAAGVELLHVPYKGGAPAVQDLVGGQIPAAVIPVGEILQYLSAGKIRVLATTGPSRSRFTPDVPSLVESGFKDLVVQSWIGVLAPAATPQSIVNKLNLDINEVLKGSDVQEVLARFGFEPVPAAPTATFSTMIREDSLRWSGVVKASGFTAED
jgi:tripartite-type tricarboxylate transporter receptor subunit TctC